MAKRSNDTNLNPSLHSSPNPNPSESPLLDLDNPPRHIPMASRHLHNRLESLLGADAGETENRSEEDDEPGCGESDR